MRPAYSFSRLGDAFFSPGFLCPDGRTRTLEWSKKGQCNISQLLIITNCLTGRKTAAAGW